jgi:hypothetical protein
MIKLWVKSNIILKFWYNVFTNMIKKPIKLFHGSTVNDIKILEPQKRYTPHGVDLTAIYATHSLEFAIAQSFPWSSDEGFNLSFFGDKMELTVPKKFRERLLQPTNVYVVSSRNFKFTKEETTGYTWHSIKPVKVLDVMKFKSVRKALIDLKVKIKYK